MATLVLTAAGNAVAGPLGAALGSIVGQSIDQQLFGSGRPRGPRLGDLAVQTSSYGSLIPRLYGTMRVAGTVVWATDLKEEEAIEGGGKGSPEVIAYQYSVSLAVALSSRRVNSVKRIWADGKLIRGTAGDFKVRTEFRLIPGDEDQPADPLIATIETIDETPAFRGLALAVFEDLQLGDFGNRIPVLTFEVEADPEPPSLSTLLNDASGALVDVDDGRTIGGYAAHGRSIADAISPLITLFGVELREVAGELRGPGAGAAMVIAEEELGCGTENRRVAPSQQTRSSSAETPASLALTYYDPSRDYQAGQKRAAGGPGGLIEERIELPAALLAEDARALVEGALSRQLATGDRMRLALSPRQLAMRPGDRLRLPGGTSVWVAERVTIEGLVTMVDAVRGVGSSGVLPADAGRAVREADAAVGRTVLMLVEPPALGDDVESSPRAFVAGSSDGAWKTVPVEVAIGAEPLTTVSLPRKAVIGRTEAALAAGTPLLLDLTGQVVVRLEDPAQVLRNADDLGLMAGYNLAMIADELVQFGRADDLGGGRYRLSRLLRGRRGSEWAIASHAAGDPFCLIDRATIRSIDAPRSAVGAVVSAVSHGVADSEPWPRTERLLTGEAMRPLSPCHLQIISDASSVRLTWTRRSQRSWAWVDGAESDDDGVAEQYRIILRGPDASLTLDTDLRSIVVARSDIPAVTGEMLEVVVNRIGRFAASQAATGSLIV